ncbi:hypothetical protein BDF20DRAFT_906703 [Mycotypha africana]|uniref:uncharacterized protein n=1 Tax=Mycotypha africana TaxID=64632 RepID=UPI002300A3E4|nr:uncharacterized protein BDF20DRAFT_906703 [Mycotypha africana]KAI8975328.1 hypothetical protein BDF20DRAFT_906703 [Mycotypha africana]
MDPYRNNQYGFRPPRMPGRYGPPPPGRSPHMTLGGRPPYDSTQTTSTAPFANNNSPTTAVSPASNNPISSDEKLNTLFVGAIAAGVGDEWIETLLKTCGNLLHWKRTKDPSGKPKGFGFATYADPDSVLCALRVLGGETTEGVTLKALDGSGVEKKLIVKADDNVRKHLEGYQKTQNQQNYEASDKEKSSQVQSYVQAIFGGQLEPSKEDAAAANALSLTAIADPLTFFKEQAAQNDLQHQQGRENDQQISNRRRSRSNDRRRHRRDSFGDDDRSSSRNRHGGGDNFVKGGTEYGYKYHQQHPHRSSSPNQEDTMTDEEIERRRKEKLEKDVENAYHQRVKRFESRQAHKLREHNKNVDREIELEERQARDREFWAERLANFDDTVEMERGTEMYYTDRSRWRRMRELQRRREEEYDEEDRRKEIQEIEDAKQREAEEARRKDEEEKRKEEEAKRLKDSGFLTREGEQQKIALKPTKINFNMPLKRNTLATTEEDEEEEAKKKRRILVPLDYSELDQEKNSHTTSANTSNTASASDDAVDKARQVKELIDSIPSEKEDLWKYPVRWDELNEDLINDKLHPFISKKIVDLLGMEEEDLVSFVLQFMKEKKGPHELVAELEGALDEDALVFVMKLWRALIFETERKHKNL